MSSCHKDLRRLIKVAEDQGWTCERAHGGHWKFRKGRKLVVVSNSPSDRRTMQNTIHDLRRA